MHGAALGILIAEIIALLWLSWEHWREERARRWFHDPERLRPLGEEFDRIQRGFAARKLRDFHEPFVLESILEREEA